MICHFSHESVFSIMHEPNIICSKTNFDSAMHEQTFICRQLFAGHVVGSRPMKKEGKMHRMINIVLAKPPENNFMGKGRVKVMILVGVGE